jgi:hypothetical protein
MTDNIHPPDRSKSANRTIYAAERASLARLLSEVLEEYRHISVNADELKLTDEEAEWIRNHPGDLLTPFRPVGCNPRVYPRV